MDRYVLVCLIEGEAREFHNRIRKDVCYKFNKRPQKLPAHITLKAPFETYKIDELVDVLRNFAAVRKKAPMKIKDFGKFRRDVVYMNVDVSLEAKKLHNDLMDELSKISWIKFKPNEGKDKVFHCTIVSKRIQDVFKEIWDYVNEYECEFNIYFDNLSLYKWENDTWNLYKKFKFEND